MPSQQNQPQRDEGEGQPTGQRVEPTQRDIRRNPRAHQHQGGDPHGIGRPDHDRPEREQQQSLREPQAPPVAPKVNSKKDPDETDALITRTVRRDLHGKGRGTDDEAAGPVNQVSADQPQESMDCPERGAAEWLPQDGREPTRGEGDRADQRPRQEPAEGTTRQRHPVADRAGPSRPTRSAQSRPEPTKPEPIPARPAG